MNTIILLVNINNHRCAIVAEGGAEDDVLDDRNGSFQNQSEEASTSKRSSGALAWKLYLHGQNLKKKGIHEEIAQLELLNTSRQRKEGSCAISSSFL